MCNYYIFRHPDDDSSGQVTLLGEKQLEEFILWLKKSNIVFLSFLSSPYPRCKNSLKIIIKELSLSINKWNQQVKLSTPNPLFWHRSFISKEFQEILPLYGKYGTALKIIPEILEEDAMYLIRILESLSVNYGNEDNIMCISHNTMILAAASYITNGKVCLFNNLQTLQGCQGILFKMQNNRISGCELITKI